MLEPRNASGQMRVEDIYDRSVNEHGIQLVDWDGYMANPLIKIFIWPPTNAVFPGSAILSVDNARVYFESPGSVSSRGPTKTISLPNATSRVPVRLSIFPDRDPADEDYTMSLVFIGANNARQTNTVPVRVQDLDLQRSNAFRVIVNFDRDVTGFFTNIPARQLTQQAADDWSYYFADMNLDPVRIGTETTYIWYNNFAGGYYFSNTNEYRGFLLYGYGTTNVTHRSGGEGSYSGPVQSSGGAPLTIKRSGGFEAEIYGNYNARGWLFLTNDQEWLATGNLAHETNDFYSIAHHEIGHALMFNRAHPGFDTVYIRGAFTNAAVTNYYGGPVPIDASHHMTGAIDPESGQGIFGYEYYGGIPRKRWLITKLDLLCAQAVGYTLRPTAALAPFSFPSNSLPPAAMTVPYSASFTATGGIPVYDWSIVDGALPPGLALNSFTGRIEGTSVTNGSHTFSVRVRDYHENGVGLTQSITIVVGPPPPVRLTVSVTETGPDQEAQLVLNGTTGQRQVIEASSNLVQWIPISTNAAGTNVFRVVESNAKDLSGRFYRAVVVQ